MTPLVNWLIDWIEFYPISAIFQPCNGGDYKAPSEMRSVMNEPILLFIEIHRNGLLCAKGIAILDTGHHLMSHQTDIAFAKRFCLHGPHLYGPCTWRCLVGLSLCHSNPFYRSAVWSYISCFLMLAACPPEETVTTL